MAGTVLSFDNRDRIREVVGVIAGAYGNEKLFEWVVTK